MLRITIHDSAAECRFRLQGRLQGASVDELEMCWRTAASTTAGRRTTADLCELEDADDAGRALLSAMARAGVEMIREVKQPVRRLTLPAWLRPCWRFSLFTLLLAFPPRF